MDELWSNDYGPYDPDWENELDELIQDAYDSDYDSDKYANVGYRDLKDTLTLVICSIASVLYFFCFILILLWCNGVIQIIYATRVAFLDLASLSQIAIIKAYTSSQTFRMEDKYDIKPESAFPPLWSVFCAVIIQGSFLIEETLPLVLLHELYMCTSKMEIRERQTLVLIKKISYSCVS